MSQPSPICDPFDADAERARITGALLAVTADLADASDADAVLERFADLLVNASAHFKLAWLYIGQPDAPVIRPQFLAGEQREYGRALEIDQSLLMRRGPARRALASGGTVLQEIPARLGAQRLLPGVRRWHSEALDAGVRSVLAMPFKLYAMTEGECGLTVLYADREDYFERVGLDPFRAFARLAQVGLDRMLFKDRTDRYQRQVHQLQFYDPLTGLPNRALLEDRLAQGIARAESGRPLYYLSLTIRDFRDLNEHAGPSVGDLVLRLVSRRLQAQAGDRLTVARRTSSEFVVLIDDPDGRKAVEALVERCLDSLEQPYPVRESQIPLNVQAVLVPIEDPEFDPEAVYRLVEQGYSRLEQNPEQRWRISDELDERTLQGQHAVASALALALEQDDLTLHFQPQLRLSGDSPIVDGVEGLLRWQRDDRMVPPGEFIPQLEQTGLIHAVGDRILDLGLSQAARWQQRQPVVRIGINVSARQLLDERFVPRLRDALLRHAGADPKAIELEITETSALRDLERASRVLRECRDLGFGIAIDDYGSGYASLAYLQQLPVTRVKIDQLFVRRLTESLRDLALVAGIIRSCQLMNIEVVAEGVETAAQAEVLARSGCDVLQGFWICRPIAAGELETWLDTPLETAQLATWYRASRQPDALERLRREIRQRDTDAGEVN